MKCITEVYIVGKKTGKTGAYCVFPLQPAALENQMRIHCGLLVLMYVYYIIAVVEHANIIMLYQGSVQDQ